MRRLLSPACKHLIRMMMVMLMIVIVAAAGTVLAVLVMMLMVMLVVVVVMLMFVRMLMFVKMFMCVYMVVSVMFVVVHVNAFFLLAVHRNGKMRAVDAAFRAHFRFKFHTGDTERVQLVEHCLFVVKQF